MSAKPRSKPHLLISDEPLTAGKDYVALCKVTVKKAAWVWDNSVDPLETLRAIQEGKLLFCRKCIETKNYGADQEKVNPLFGRYLYGAIDGELLHQEQSL